MRVDERAWIAELLRQKADAREAQTVGLPTERVSAWRAEIAAYEIAAASLPAPIKRDSDALDDLFQAWVG